MNRAAVERMIREADLSHDAFEYLLNCHCEFEWLDYKMRLNLESDKEVAEFARDALAMKNMGGGYILIGVRDKTWEPEGLKCAFPYDSKMLIDKVIKGSGVHLSIYVVIHRSLIQGTYREFALIHVHASRKRRKRRRPSVVCKDFHPKEKWGLRRGDIFIRRVDSTQRVSSEEQLSDLLEQLEAMTNEDELIASGRGSPFAIHDGLYKLLERGYSTFIGRNELRQEVLNAVTHDPRIWIVNVHGPGGVGKSAVVNWATYELYDKKAYEAIIHLSAKETQLTPSGIKPHGRSLYSLDSLLDQILATFEEKTDRELEEKKELASDYLSAWKTLLVLDNMETLSDERVVDYLQNLPTDTKAKVLMTSRRRTSGWELPVAVSEFSPVETEEFLRVRSDEMRANFPITRKTIRRVHEVTGGLPLAIQWILGRFKIDPNAKSALRQVRSRESPVLEFSFRNIWDGLSPDAKAALSSMSIFEQPPTIQEIEIATEWTPERAGRALEELSESTLVEKVIHQEQGHAVYVALPITLNFAEHQLASMRDFERVCRQRIQSYQDKLKLSDYEEETFIGQFEKYGLETQSERKAAILCIRGQSAAFDPDSDEAAVLFREARQTAPHHAYVYAMSAVFELTRNRTKDALQYARKACKKADANTGGLAYSTLARVLLVKQDKMGRVDALRKAVEYSPKNHVYKHQLGVALSMAGETERAIRVFSEIIDDERAYSPPRETLVIALNTRIMNLIRLGKKQDASKDLAYAMELMSEYPYLNRHKHYFDNYDQLG